MKWRLLAVVIFAGLVAGCGAPPEPGRIEKAVQAWRAPPREPSKLGAIVAPEPTKPSSQAAPEARKPSAGAPSERGKTASKVKSKPIPKQPSARVCALIGQGMNAPFIGGRNLVIKEAAKRGYSKASTEQAITDCGY